MEPITKKLLDKKAGLYMQQQKVATIACVSKQNTPYCFNAYYVFNEQENLLYFKSSADTLHMQYIKSCASVAGTILPDKLMAMETKGVQFTGIVISNDDELAKSAADNYYFRLPFAKVIPGEVTVIRIDSVKMTDSTWGIGKKIFWSRE